jgi:hypothetical protein
METEKLIPNVLGNKLLNQRKFRRCVYGRSFHRQEIIQLDLGKDQRCRDEPKQSSRAFNIDGGANGR